MAKKIRNVLWCVLIFSCTPAVKREVSDHGGSHPGNDSNNNFTIQPTQPTGLLGVFNACDKPIWVQTPAAANGIPTNQQLVQLLPKQQFNYNTTQVHSLRLWGKFSCDATGNNCAIGQEIAPCFTNGGCQPPIDTSFELDTSNPAEAFYDITMVNGFTGPMKVVVFGSNLPAGCNSIQTPTNLSISQICPKAEMLNTPLSGWAPTVPVGFTTFGDFTTYNNPFGQTIDFTQPHSLLAPSLANPNNIIGCFSPGQKLASVPAWGGLGVGLCVGAQCKTQPVGQPPDINSTGGTAGAYDSRVVMYQNPYNGCDLTYPASSANCTVEHTTPVQTTHGPLASPNNFSDNLVAFCNTGSNFTNSPYCSDAQAASTPAKTAAANMGKLGPIVNTNYVKNIHTNVPNVYAWQYDDINALQQCNSSAAKFVVMIGCPVQ